MLTIRPTKMLARRLGIELPTAPPVVTNRVADWCAHEFRASRYRYLVFCNTASLYPVVMLATGVTDEDRLIRRLLGGLQVCLVGTGLQDQFQRRILPAAAVVQWAPIPDRSVLGAMNEMIFMAKSGLQDGKNSPAGLSRWMAATPLTTLGGNSPNRVFPKLGQ